MTLPPLPPPDTHCWDEDTSKDVWSHSADQMRAYAEQAVAAERAEIERLRAALNDIATHMSSDWPERCIRHVQIARAALKEPT
jgi:hypothetical protein